MQVYFDTDHAAATTFMGFRTRWHLQNLIAIDDMRYVNGTSGELAGLFQLR